MRCTLAGGMTKLQEFYDGTHVSTGFGWIFKIADETREHQQLGVRTDREDRSLATFARQNVINGAWKLYTEPADIRIHETF